MISGRSILMDLNSSIRNMELQFKNNYIFLWIIRHIIRHERRDRTGHIVRMGSSNCSTKEMSITMTTLFSAVKGELQSYCEKVYSRSNINQMWILENSKNPKDLLDKFNSRTFLKLWSIQTFGFSTRYITIPGEKLNTRHRNRGKIDSPKHIHKFQ